METQENTRYGDFKAGLNDRRAGYYDKWYRYNRQDGGKAYDNGVKAAINDWRCKLDCQIIDCMN